MAKENGGRGGKGKTQEKGGESVRDRETRDFNGKCHVSSTLRFQI